MKTFICLLTFVLNWAVVWAIDPFFYGQNVPLLVATAFTGNNDDMSPLEASTMTDAYPKFKDIEEQLKGNPGAIAFVLSKHVDRATLKVQLSNAAVIILSVVDQDGDLEINTTGIEVDVFASLTMLNCEVIREIDQANPVKDGKVSLKELVQYINATPAKQKSFFNAARVGALLIHLNLNKNLHVDGAYGLLKSIVGDDAIENLGKSRSGCLYPYQLYNKVAIANSTIRTFAVALVVVALSDENGNATVDTPAEKQVLADILVLGADKHATLDKLDIDQDGKISPYEISALATGVTHYKDNTGKFVKCEGVAEEVKRALEAADAKVARA